MAVGATASDAVPEVLPMPRAFTGSYSPEAGASRTKSSGSASRPTGTQNQSSLWRHYRGGRTQPIR